MRNLYLNLAIEISLFSKTSSKKVLHLVLQVLHLLYYMYYIYIIYMYIYIYIYRQTDRQTDRHIRGIESLKEQNSPT